MLSSQIGIRRQPATIGWLLLPLLLAPGPALAQQKNCYDGFSNGGCPWKVYLKEAEVRALSCDNLAFMRNRIYKENGYCFRDPGVKAQLGNEGCKWPLQQLTPLNAHEKANVALIRKVERAKRCKVPSTGD